MDKIEDMLGFSSIDAASRALQGYFGYVSFFLMQTNEENKFNDLAVATFESIQMLDSMTEEEHISVFSRTKKLFIESFAINPLPIFKSNADELWQVFVKRFNSRTMQLRANIIDTLKCINLDFLAKRSNKNKRYYHQLPLSSEIVLTPGSRGVKLEIVIPPRLLILDMILMLVHARYEQRQIEKLFKGQVGKGFIEVDMNGRLDAYARQVLMLATTICDNVLTEYGYIVKRIAQQTLNQMGIDELDRLDKKGVTYKLKFAPITWSGILETQPKYDREIFEDMISLVQIRNRLVHPDGRLNCWHAFQLSPITGTGWKFSNRIKPYISRGNYIAANSHIGYEYALSRFCVDTTIATVNNLHGIIYPEDRSASWVEMSIKSKGRLNLDKVIQQEKSLQVSRWM